MANITISDKDGLTELSVMSKRFTDAQMKGLLKGKRTFPSKPIVSAKPFTVRTAQPIDTKTQLSNVLQLPDFLRGKR